MSDVGGQKSEIRGQGLESRCRKSEAGRRTMDEGKGPEVGGQRSEV